MSGGGFSVGLKNVTSSEKIIKIKSFLFDIDNNVKDTVYNNENTKLLLQDIDFMNCSTDNVALSENSRGVSCHIAGYIAKKLKKRYGSCCNQFLIASPITSESLEYPYIETLSGGGLNVPSLSLANYVSTAFAILDFSYGAISRCGLPSQLEAETILKHVFNSFQTFFTCKAHESTVQTFTNRTIANIYLNNQRKVLTDAAVADGVRSIKKRQREK